MSAWKIDTRQPLITWQLHRCAWVILLEKRSVASRVVPGEKVWLDSKHTPIDIPYKLTARWFGPFEVLSSDGAAVTLDLPEIGRASCRERV